ncbi:MAG: MCE family protein, partial [Mycobacterium sp.]
MTRSRLRPLVGLVSIILAALVVAGAVVMFRGGLPDRASVTVLSARAGLVMNPDAKVLVRGVQVGRVASIEDLPNGQAALHLELDPSQLDAIPANALVQIASPTVFGAKQVQFVIPDAPSAQSLREGQTVEAGHVMVEVNTVFEQLTSVMSSIEPAKLNETLGALAQAMSGRGQKVGQMLSDLDAFLAKLEPSLPAMSHDLEIAPKVVGAYADASSDLVSIADSASTISDTIVDQKDSLDAALVSVIGLADIGNQV